MRKLLFKALCILLLLSSETHASGAVFDFKSLPGELQSQIERQFPELKSGTFTERDLDRLVEELVVKNQYDSVEVLKQTAGDQVVYRVRLGRTSRIEKIVFQGLDSLSETEIRREMLFSEKSPFDPAILAEAQSRIERYYKTQGFAQVRVDFEFQRPADRGVLVKVIIKEGPQTQLQEFVIDSPNPKLNQQLSRALRSSFNKQALNDKTLAEMREFLRQWLATNAYFRTEIIDPGIQPLAGRPAARVAYRFRNATQYEVYFEGNRDRHRTHLEKVLDLERFNSSNPNLSAELGGKIKTYYVSTGFARAEVSTREDDGRTPFEKKIIITINEGPRIKIRGFEWVGNFSDEARVYEKFLRNQSGAMVAEGYYVKEDIDAGLKNLIVDRWNKGFLRARVVSTRAIYTDKKDEVIVQVNLDEGRITQVRKIIITGNQRFSREEILDMIELREGERLRLYELESALQTILRNYRGAGYLDVAIGTDDDEVVLYNEDNTQADVRFKIVEGPQVLVGTIVIEGNTLTKDEIILRELEFDYGNVLTPEKIEESTLRLQRTGYFSTVEISTLEERTPIAQRTVRVKVVDRDPGLLNAGIGVNSERGITLRGYSGIAYRNIAGTGRGISLRADASYNINEIKFPEWKLTAGYLEPYMFNSRMKGRVNLSLSTQITDFARRIAADAEEQTFSLEQNVTSHVLVSWDVLKLATLRDFKFETKEQLSSLKIGSTGPTVDLDFRDKPFNPTKGTFTRLNIEYGSPFWGSDPTISFLRAQAAFTHYQSLGDPRWVWANSLRGGYLKNMSDRSDGAVPYDKKGLLLGGQASVRGFTPEEAFPNQNDFPAADFDETQGRYSLRTEATLSLLKSELRFPIRGQWTGAVFYDGGAVQVKGVSFDHPYRASFGLGLRYLLPVAAFNMEYAWKAKPLGDRGESPGVFHISFSTF